MTLPFIQKLKSRLNCSTFALVVRLQDKQKTHLTTNWLIDLELCVQSIHKTCSFKDVFLAKCLTGMKEIKAKTMKADSLFKLLQVIQVSNLPKRTFWQIANDVFLLLTL